MGTKAKSINKVKWTYKKGEQEIHPTNKMLSQGTLHDQARRSTEVFPSQKMCENNKNYIFTSIRHQGTKSGSAKALTTNLESNSIQTWLQCLSKASSMARIAAKHSASQNDPMMITKNAIATSIATMIQRTSLIIRGLGRWIPLNSSSNGHWDGQNCIIKKCGSKIKLGLDHIKKTHQN